MKEFKEIMKNVTTDQSSFFQYFDAHDDEFKLILNEFDEDQYGWGVYYHENTGMYIYVNQDEDNAEVYEVKLIASLNYDSIHDCNADGEELDELFDNTCCGEQVTDNEIKYLWFE